MATKPTINLPGWVTAIGNIAEPSGSKKSSGYAPMEPLPAQHANWIFNSVSDWVAYFAALAANETLDVSASTVLTSTVRGKIVRLVVDATSYTLTLPAPATMLGAIFKIKDVSGKLSDFPVLLARNGSELFELLAGDYLLEANYGEWTIFCDGTNYYLV